MGRGLPNKNISYIYTCSQYSYLYLRKILHLLCNMKTQRYITIFCIFLIKLLNLVRYLPDMQEYTYYDPQSEQHYQNFRYFLHHVLFHHYQILVHLSLLILVVYHEHRFHNQHQAKLIIRFTNL
jgi:hypothetical protein